MSTSDRRYSLALAELEGRPRLSPPEPQPLGRAPVPSGMLVRFVGLDRDLAEGALRDGCALSWQAADGTWHRGRVWRREDGSWLWRPDPEAERAYRERQLAAARALGRGDWEDGDPDE